MGRRNANKFVLLIHTMTITESDCIVQAQFFHTFSENMREARLVGRRLRLRIHPELGSNRNKAILHRLNAPDLRTLLKRNSSNVKHHLRALHLCHFSPQVRNSPSPRIENVLTNIGNSIVVAENVVSKPPPEKKEPPLEIQTVDKNLQLTQQCSPEQTANWLSLNRFDKYLETFERFSGNDMLRMSRDDLIQICGDADGIRLHNTIHLKTIAPKLTIYVCRENSLVFNAVFLSAHSNIELLQKLTALAGISQEKVRDIYIEGPHSIHVQLNNDVLKHIKEETMFSLEVMQEKSGYILLLKHAVK